MDQLMKRIIFSSALFILFFSTFLYSGVKEPDDFEQIDAVLTGNLELENKLTLFEKYSDNWIGAFKSKKGELTIFRIDSNLKYEEISKIKFRDDENIIYHKIANDKLMMIFAENNKIIYARTALFDINTGKVVNSELVYGILPPDLIKDGELIKDLDYNVNDNYELIALKNWDKLNIQIKDAGKIKVIYGSENNNILLYNFVKTGSDDIYICFSIISQDGKIIKNGFKLLDEKAFNKYKFVNGFYGNINSNGVPFFLVDFAGKRERKIMSFAVTDDEIISAETEYPLEINGSNEHFIKSSVMTENPNKFICLINEEEDSFSKTFGLLMLELSDNLKSLDRKIKIWSKDELNNLTSKNKLASNMISDILKVDDDYCLIIESNELEIVYEQSTYIPVSYLREALVMRINNNLETVWHHFIKDRDFKRILSCDNKSKYLVDPTLRFSLKFDRHLTKDGLGLFYGDNDNELFVRKVLNINDGKVMKDNKLFEIDKLFFLYPNRIYSHDNQVLMYLSVDCDSHIVKFKLGK